jgi:hypothetical protein
MQLRESLHRASNCHATLQPRNGHPGASVRAGSEGEMPVRFACNVEPVGIGKFVRIAIRRTDAQREIRAWFEHDIAHYGAFDDQPITELIRALETQAFLDRRSDQLGLRAQALQRIGMCEQVVVS